MERKKAMAFNVVALVGLVGLFFLASAGPLQAAEEGKGMAIAADKKVSIEYTLTLEDKSVVDTNVGKDPLTFVYGNGQIIPGLEKALEGLRAGDKKQVTVPPAQAYGEVHPEAVVEIGKEKLPPEALHAGARIQGQTPDGRPLRGQVTEVKDETAVIDFNHPLAGKTLYFDVTVLNVR